MQSSQKLSNPLTGDAMLFSVALALFLTAQQSASPPPAKPSKPLGTFDDPSANAARPLKSVGVRGTIDAGGYAASAEVKNQSEFYEQLADLQVAALRPAWAPCHADKSLRNPAISLLTRGDFPAAATTLEALLRTNNQPAAHQLLGLAYEGSGQLEAAAEQFRVAAAARPEPAAFIAHGAALLFLGEVDRAEETFYHASAQIVDQEVFSRLGLGAALFQHGQVTQALGVFLGAADAQPSEDLSFGFIAVALRSADPVTLSHSIDLLRSLTRRSPKSGGAHYAVACGLMAASGGAPNSVQSAEIEAELKNAVGLDPHLADAHFRLASIYADREALPGAIAEYRSALDCNPRFVEAHYRLSQIYIRSGHPERGKEELELHQRLRAQQKSEIEGGKIALRFRVPSEQACP
jgi:tetratricopeptide (TPR) repeat protein